MSSLKITNSILAPNGNNLLDLLDKRILKNNCNYVQTA